jgi:hypothetical protein
MTSPAQWPSADAEQAVESYLADVAVRLPCPARPRTDIVAELRAGLLDSVDSYRSAGLAPAEATGAAIGDFGDPREIAAAFGPELAVRSSRRIALALVAAGPVIGVLWVVAAAASHLAASRVLPWQWASAPSGFLLDALPLVAAVLAVTVAAALFTVAATGRLGRWLPQRPRLIPAAAATAGFGAAFVDVIVLALLASQLISVPGRLAPVPVAAAAAASLLRLTLARRAARRCLRVRATL